MSTAESTLPVPPRGRFTNLDGGLPTVSFRAILQWQLGLHDERRPRSPATGVVVPAVDNDGLALRGALRDRLTWIGHASFLAQLGGQSVLIDPVLSPRIGPIRRNIAPGLELNRLPPIDIVCVTHNHRDHMDASTLRRLGERPLYIVPRGAGRWFRRAGLPRVLEMEWWQSEDVGGVEITFVPAQHWSRRGLLDTNTSWWGGFVLHHDGLRLYHSGDTAYFDGFQAIRERCGAPHVAMLPIGAYAPRWFMRTQHMDPADSLRAFQDLGAERFVAMHWGTFKLTDEPLDEPPQVLRTLWERTSLAADRCVLPAIGETLDLG